jgi:branched-chain amino acid transport system ATP-binding protein
MRAPRAGGGRVLEVRGLSLDFGRLRVLDAVDLEVASGEIVAMVGPNGAGKTSVINCVSGFYRPTAGRIALDGRAITGLRPHRIAGLGLARTFQHVELFRHLSVIDNLMLGRHALMRESIVAGGLWIGPARREEARHRERVEVILEFLELERVRKRLLGSLAYGVQKLVGIGAALATEPGIMMLDEPASGMNRQEKEDLARFLLRIKHELGIGLLWVEHDMQLVADLADRLVVLHYGRKVAEGAPSRVLGDPEVTEAFLGRARTR